MPPYLPVPTCVDRIPRFLHVAVFPASSCPCLGLVSYVVSSDNFWSFLCSWISLHSRKSFSPLTPLPGRVAGFRRLGFNPLLLASENLVFYLRLMCVCHFSPLFWRSLISSGHTSYTVAAIYSRQPGRPYLFLRFIGMLGRPFV